MTVNTKNVAGRRKLHYNSLDELLQDAERVAGDNVQMVGNWSAGQVMRHQAITMNFSIDGFPFQFPWVMRKVLGAFMKRRFLTKPLSSGFQIPSYATSVMPEPVAAADGRTELAAAIERLKNEPQRALHPGLEHLTAEEWEQFHLRHAELHMSFAVPQEQG